ncbi:MAG: DNA repair protein RecN, partial [Eubacteriales bacterium]
GACSLLQIGEDDLRRAKLSDLSERLSEARLLAEDVGEGLRDLGREIDVTPEEIDQMESRLDQIHRLKKKYGNSCEEMLAYLDTCRSQLEELTSSDERMAQLEAQEKKQLATTKKVAVALTKARTTAATQLQARVESELRELDMPKVTFCVAFEAKTCRWEMDETGADKVQFLLSANIGEDLKPIQKVASGGELARVMLAMKNVLAQDDGIATLVFDEVDAGVSGRAAQKVAEKMSDVATYKQVLCVTHLPQIAAMADAHLQVEKGESAGRTYTAVTTLDRTGRQGELSRLMGGSTITQAMLDSAEELLTQADGYRSR